MKDKMSSRERLLATINHEEPDRVPICFRDVAPLEKKWKNPFERVMALRELGVDDKIFIHPPQKTFYSDAASKEQGSNYGHYGRSPWPFHPDVTVREWEDSTIDERYTVIFKVIETPGGELRMAARKTKDWQVETLPLVSDYLWSRGVEFLLKGPEDLEKLRYIFYDPCKADLTDFRDSVRAIKDFAAKHDVLLEGDVGSASDIALNVRGPMNLINDTMENPGFVEELVAMIAGWNLRRLELILEVGVDTIYHSACYETTSYWSPDMYRRFFRPHVQKKLDVIHQAEVKLHYYMDVGAMLLVHDFKEMGIDILSTLDPPPYGDTDLTVVKREIGDRVCLWGGVNSPQTIERGSPEDVREAVKSAVSVAAPGGGFVLSTADSIYDAGAYNNVMAFIEAGHEFGKYPISV